MSYNVFREGNFKPYHSRFNEKDYGKVLDNIVIACVDALIISGDDILLGKRQQEPLQNWWLFGGRMKTGESFQKAISRVIRRELGAKIAPERFHPIATNSFIFNIRSQKPQSHGCHMVQILLKTHAKKAEIPLDSFSEEYSKVSWFGIRGILSAKQEFHPFLLKIIEDIS